MLPTSARFALLASAPLLSGPACAEAPASPAVVLAPAAPRSSASAPTVDSSTAATSGEARVPSAALGSDASDAGAPAEFRGCNVDADCLAVPRVGCCHNGWNEAVAASRRDAYAASFVCPEAHPVCAMFIVRDGRAAQCDAATHLCTLVAR